MEKLKFSEKEIVLTKHLVHQIMSTLYNQGVRNIDSNMIHVMFHRLNHKCKLNLTHGWFIHGPYYPCLDDILVELGVLSEKEHQMYGNPSMELSQTIFEKEETI